MDSASGGLYIGMAWVSETTESQALPRPYFKRFFGLRETMKQTTRYNSWPELSYLLLASGETIDGKQTMTFAVLDYNPVRKEIREARHVGYFLSHTHSFPKMGGSPANARDILEKGVHIAEGLRVSIFTATPTRYYIMVSEEKNPG